MIGLILSVFCLVLIAAAAYQSDELRLTQENLRHAHRRNAELHSEVHGLKRALSGRVRLAYVILSPDDFRDWMDDQ